MPYTPIAIDRKALTIMNVPFPDLDTLETTAEASCPRITESSAH
jgi:hypothetical protein